MKLVEEMKEMFIKTAEALKGSERRLFMARTVRALGEGGQRLAERELDWNRATIRKGGKMRDADMECKVAFLPFHSLLFPRFLISLVTGHEPI
jgi:hypothetical protein